MCTHTKWVYPEPALNDWTGELENVPPYEEYTYVDMDVGRFKCTQCNEVQYYTGLWKRFYEEGIPCAGSDRAVKNEMKLSKEELARAQHAYNITFDAGVIASADRSNSEIAELRAEIDNLKSHLDRARLKKAEYYIELCEFIGKEPAIDKYRRLEVDKDETDPIERLRAFCSFAMSGQDWIDVEPFFDEIKKDLK